MDYRKGMRLKAINSKTVIELISRKSGNRHWNTRKIGKKKSHMIHEGTLEKYYAEI